MSRYATLLLLLKHMGFVNGRVQFQKLIFLLEKNYHIKTEYDFIPFKFGPYCQVVQQDIQHLIDYGYIEHEEVEKTGSEVGKSLSPEYLCRRIPPSILKSDGLMENGSVR